MKAEGIKRMSATAKRVTLALVVAAAGLGVYALSDGGARPSSDDASIDADTWSDLLPQGDENYDALEEC